MSGKPEIHGKVDPSYGRVADAFAQNFVDHGEVGAALCIYRDGVPVVDIWAGVADIQTGAPWQEDTTVTVFSATKGVTAICVHRLAERGQLDLDAPIATYWPEFAANGKADITARMVLAHRAGVPAIDAKLTMEEVLAWGPVIKAIESQEPVWLPGTDHGYHMRTFGWILGELVRRVTGRSIGQHFAKEIAAPLGLRFWIGVPDEELARMARRIPPDLDLNNLPFEVPPLAARVFTGPSNLFHSDEVWDRPDVIKAEIPASNGAGEARALARLYAGTIGEIDGIRLLNDETARGLSVVQSQGFDQVTGGETAYSLGFMVKPYLSAHVSETTFGHYGAGGSMAYADPASGLALGYAMNKMRLDLTGDPRTAAIILALPD